MDEIVKTIAAIQIEQASAKVLLAENTETIKEIKTDTADMLEVFESWKGSMRVMEMIGKLAKPLGYIVGLGASIAAFWAAMKSGVSRNERRHQITFAESSPGHRYGRGRGCHLPGAAAQRLGSAGYGAGQPL